MTGVEILASSEVAIEYTFNWAAFGIAYGVIFAVFVAFGIFMTVRYDELIQMLIGVVLGLIIGGIFSPIIGFVLVKPSKYETEYKVTISEEVSMTEFYEHYEVIEQDGKIFTVRER